MKNKSGKGPDRSGAEKRGKKIKASGITNEGEFFLKHASSILSASRANIDIIDSDFNVLYVDTEWRKIYGDPEGRKCYEYFMGRDKPCPGCGLVKAIETKKPHVTEEVLTKGGGKVVRVTSIPFKDENGKWFAAELNIDITEQKKVEEDLKMANTFLDAVIDNIPNMLFIKDAKELRFVKFNRAGEELLGYSREEMLGKNDYDFFPKEQADFFISKDKEVLSGCARVDIPEENIDTRKKGKKVLHTQKVTICNGHGNPEFLLGVSEDITERKKAEARIKLFRDLVNQSRDEIFLVDARTGRFLDANDYALRTLGYKRDEMLKMRVTDIEAIIPDKTLWNKHIKEVKASEGLVLVGQHRKKSGELLPVEINVKYVEMEGEEYIVAVARDITERKKFEEKIIESEARYRTIFDNTGSVMAIIEEDMTIVMVNSEFERFFGLSKQETEGKMTLSELLCKEEREKVEDYHKLRRIDADAAPSNYQLKVIDSGGNVSETYVTVAMIPGTKMSVVSILNVTELKRNEFELERQRDLLKNINKALEHKINELSEAMRHIKKLEGLVPICSSCKKMMKSGDDPKRSESWVSLEKYISDRTDASFTHGLCPDCIKKLYGDIADKKNGGRI
jgi:PAS domain S-box-containing protein